jgi:sugar lactone lactonase YvrE
VTAADPPLAVPCSARPGALSEGPRWDGDRDELLWVDIVSSRLHRARVGADGQFDEATPIQFDRFVGAAAPAAGGGGYVLAAGPGFLFVDRSGRVVELAQPEAGHDHVRMNDGACDRRVASGRGRWPTTNLPGPARCIASSSTARARRS